MMAERIRCTEADLRAAYRIQGLRPANGPVDGPAVAASISPDSGLVGSDGSLTATTRMVLPVLARPERIISVSAVTVGQDAVDSAMILAPYGGGPFVLRGDRDGQVDLVALDSPTAAVSLLDEMMVITGPPTTSATADVHIDHVTWLGLLAAADAQRAARLESQLERGSDTTATFNAARIEHLIDQALHVDDTRWILGAEALVDRAFVEQGKGMGQEALSGLVTSRLAEPVAGNMAVLTDTGRLWAEMLSTFVRLSHVRILHVIDGAPTDIIGMTFFRSPTDVAVAQIGSNAVTIMSLNADVAAATLRVALEGTAEREHRHGTDTNDRCSSIAGGHKLGRMGVRARPRRGAWTVRHGHNRRNAAAGLVVLESTRGRWLGPRGRCRRVARGVGACGRRPRPIRASAA